jgi:hypothetical protein
MTPDEMIQVTKVWVDPTTPAHLLILKTEDLAGLLPRANATHVALKAANQPGEDPRLTAIIQLQAKLDVRHDAIIRGVWGTLTQKAELIGGDEGASLIVLRDYLLPDGLASQLKTYGAEAGQAERLADRMTPAVRAQTDAIMIGQAPNARPLTAYIDEWIKLGQQLGDLENERGQLLATPSDGKTLYQAQLAWIRVVNAMIANAELADLDEASQAVLFGQYRAALKKANDRAREALAAARAAAEKEATDKAAAEKAAADAAAKAAAADAAAKAAAADAATKAAAAKAASDAAAKAAADAAAADASAKTAADKAAADAAAKAAAADAAAKAASDAAAKAAADAAAADAAAKAAAGKGGG